MHVCMYSVCLGVCMYICIYSIYEYVYVCTYSWLCARVVVKRVFMFTCVGMVTCCNDSDPFVRSEPVTGDPNQIRICALYGPDLLVIRRPPHEMIQRFVPIRAVKTRRRFDSKIASFHVSVCLLVYFNSSFLSYHFMRMCIWFPHYSIHAQLLWYCDALVLFYCYVVYTV